LRNVEEDRQNVAAIDVLQIHPAGSMLSVPVAEVVNSIGTSLEDPLIWRRDRRRTITIQSSPILGVTAPELQAAIAQDVESLPLPPGFTLEWGGDHESSADANGSLVPGMIPAFAVMTLIIVALFNAFRPPLIIFSTIPFALIGITVGLLAFDVPFGFMALLGAMSLAGMMIKNAVVLLDQIGIDRAAGMPTRLSSSRRWRACGPSCWRPERPCSGCFRSCRIFSGSAWPLRSWAAWRSARFSQ
jgi:multidrug efflux pump subunit AcrB